MASQQPQTAAAPAPVASPGRWFYGWNVLAVALFTAATSLGIVIGSFTFFAVAWIDEFDLSRGQVMLVLSACQISGGFLFPVAGYLLDRYRIRWIGAIGLSFLAGGLALGSLASSLWHFFAIYTLLFAVADTLAGTMLTKTLAVRWFRANQGFALGIASMGTSTGILIFPPITAFLLAEFGWRMAMLGLGAIALLVTLPLLLLVVRNDPAEKGVAPEPEGKIRKPSATDGELWPTMKILRSRQFWFIVIAFLPLIEVTTGLSSNIGPYTQDLNIDTQRAAYLISLWSAMMIVGKLIFGALSDRIDLRILFFTGLTFFATAMVLLSLEPGYPLLLLTMVILGLAAGGQLPLIGVMISRHFGAAAFGSVMGMFYLCIRPVAFAAPLAGWIRDTFGSYDYFWLGGLTIALVCAPVMLISGKSTERNTETTSTRPDSASTRQKSENNE